MHKLYIFLYFFHCLIAKLNSKFEDMYNYNYYFFFFENISLYYINKFIFQYFFFFLDKRILMFIKNCFLFYVKS